MDFHTHFLAWTFHFYLDAEEYFVYSEDYP
jgi:hypothetical protein